jgi:hypothetical protein
MIVFLLDASIISTIAVQLKQFSRGVSSGAGTYKKRVYTMGE